MRQTIIFLFSFSIGVNCFGQGVDWADTVTINGTRQWIHARGKSEKNPVLLFLHGGPGNSVMAYARKFTGELEKEYVVVHWDQRNSGKTAAISTDTSRVTLGVMKQDVASLIQYLCKRFACDKIYLAGHSWGGFLALVTAQEHPAWIRACIAISPMVKQEESERQSLTWMIGRAQQLGRTDALGELRQVRVPFVSSTDLYLHRKWLGVLQGRKPVEKEFVETWSRQWLPLFREASAVDLTSTATVFNCPVYFFLGTNDWQTASQITAEYYQRIKAEKKDLFWFTKSAHSLNLTEPKRLQEIILSLKSR